MRPIGITIIFWMYIFTTSLFIAEIVVLTPLGIHTIGADGNVIDSKQFIEDNAGNFRGLTDAALNPERNQNTLDRILQWAQSGWAAAWELISLMSGSYAFNAMLLIGVPNILVSALQLLYPFFVILTMIYYVVGR